MILIKPCQLSDTALLSTYMREGAYTDCYTTVISKPVTHAQYVSAFYTTIVFKLERLILKWAVSRPSSDAQAKQLAEGATDKFSAWYVEKRCENQLLMCDFRGRTRSWLMIESVESGNDINTRLYFGSAVVPVKNKKTGKSSFGLGFYALLGFHKFYSRVLLYFAKLRLLKV